MAKTKKENAITSVAIYMFKMGTGDCFLLKFMAKKTVKYKMLIDCGTISGGKEKLLPILETLKKKAENHVDLLVVTHEHKDHVYGFEVGESLFGEDFKVDAVWMAWSEKDGDDTVEAWKKEHGEKKMALAAAAERMKAPELVKDLKNALGNSLNANGILKMHEQFATALSEFADLHVSGGEYKNGLKGMEIVKNKIAKNKIDFKKRGDVIDAIPELPGVRIWVLGPPELWEEIKTESGSEDETFRHKKELDQSEFLMHAINRNNAQTPDHTLSPFEKRYVADQPGTQAMYENGDEAWRKIDHDWLYSSGGFALRLNSLTNNLSLVLAIEFVETGKVLLFPGDAEIGSWQSWHKIDWKSRGYAEDTTKKLLNKVVFYKVAHHLSHNGTAKSIGLDLMTNPEMYAMATLDYGVIQDGWKSTMPNPAILKSLLEKTKGRLMVMNESGLFYDPKETVPLSAKIREFRAKMSVAEQKAFEKAIKKEVEEDEGYLRFELGL